MITSLSLGQAGHRLVEKRIVRDNRYLIRAVVSQWIADDAIHGILVTGGTGFTGRDSTPEAIHPLLDKEMPGFGEMFRVLSFEEIGTSTLQSRAFAGLANETFVFCLPARRRRAAPRGRSSSARSSTRRRSHAISRAFARGLANAEGARPDEEQGLRQGAR